MQPYDSRASSANPYASRQNVATTVKPENNPRIVPAYVMPNPFSVARSTVSVDEPVCFNKNSSRRSASVPSTHSSTAATSRAAQEALQGRRSSHVPSGTYDSAVEVRKRR